MGYDAYLTEESTDYSLPVGELENFTADLGNFPKAEMRKNGK